MITKAKCRVPVLLILAFLAAGCNEAGRGRSGAAAGKFRKTFSNPGGMWMPEDMAEQVNILTALGVENPHSLSKLDSYPLGAVVWLGGGSASFVSAEGLIITNHHCITSTLQFNSTPENNLLEKGFLAHSRAEELPAETGKRVWITQEFIDVTPRITEGLERIEDPVLRYTEIENRIKAIIAENENERAGMRCSVEKIFEGRRYSLVRKLELRDIRLVYAPADSIGCYGGDIDNWHWPRHAGEFSFLRAYVGPDGRPAEYSPDNIPYRPRQYLRIAQAPLSENDVVMVVGYPGKTRRWNTAGQIQFTCTQEYPVEIEILHEVADVYKKLAAEDKALAIKTTPSIKGVMNSLQLLELILDNVRDGNLIAQKVSEQKQFVDWINSDARRKERWGGILEKIDTADVDYQRRFYRNYLVDCMVQHIKLINSAHMIVRMAEERPKPNMERDPDYQQRNWDRLIQRQRRMQKSYDPRIDKALICFYLGKVMQSGGDDGHVILEQFFPGKEVLADRLEENVSDFFGDRLKMEDPNCREELFRNATLEELRSNTDPMIQLALRLRPLTREMEDRDKVYEGTMAMLMPDYVDAIKAWRNNPLAPDANGTLRVTYGTVRGYRPNSDAPPYIPFTTLAEQVAKNQGHEPFDLPQKLLDAADSGAKDDFCFCKGIGDVPVNFLSDVDITGGNSGSPTLNSRGQLVGLLFDGNSKSVASNLLFMPDITRAIHVDIRYVVWIMKYVDHADNLLCEMGVEK
jgi:hypothetical protein